MAYWLMKSEPDAWSWEQQVAKGAKGEAWSGVRNHTAKLNLMKMKKGDRAFFYHSNVGKEIVGVLEIVREHYPDPSAKPGDPSPATTARYIEMSGTSQAAPHVSGAIAAFLSIRWEFVGESERVKAIFKNGATSLGRGPTFQGSGLLDLMRAIQSV